MIPMKPVSKGKIPIIVVPSVITSIISIFNAEEFLIKGVYTPCTERGEKISQRYIVYQHRRYQLVDDASKLSEEEWDRVLAVFATGQAWQFKDWKISNPAQLFQRVLGVHVIVDDRLPPPLIAQWNCRLLKVSMYYV